MAAIRTCQTNIIRYLMIEQNISPDFNLEQVQITTPLNMLIRYSKRDKAGHRDPKELCELLTLFHQKGSKFNQRKFYDYPLYSAANALYFHSFPPDGLRKIIEFGGNPFGFAPRDPYAPLTDGFDHPLKEAHRVKRGEGVEILLSYGAGLIRKELRTEKHELDRHDVGDQPHLSYATLSNSEIIFFDSMRKKWIYSVKELSEMLESVRTFDDETSTLMDIIARYVLDPGNHPDVLVSGVQAAFKKYYDYKRAWIVCYYETLIERGILLPLARIGIEHIETDKVLIDEATAMVKKAASGTFTPGYGFSTSGDGAGVTQLGANSVVAPGLNAEIPAVIPGVSGRPGS